MNEYLKKNRELWNELTTIHIRSEFYDVDGRRRLSVDTLPLTFSIKATNPES